MVIDDQSHIDGRKREVDAGGTSFQKVVSQNKLNNFKRCHQWEVACVTSMS